MNSISNTFLGSNSTICKPFEILPSGSQQMRHATYILPNTSSVSCAVTAFFAAAFTTLTHNFLPFAMTSLACVDKVDARWSSFEGVLTLQPGESYYGEGTRKLALCKSGATAWDSSSTCPYPGPPLHVSINLLHGRYSPSQVLHDGLYTGSNQWMNIGTLGLEVTNTADSVSQMYVHLENN